jgi:hypothetical protein
MLDRNINDSGSDENTYSRIEDFRVGVEKIVGGQHHVPDVYLRN